VTSLELPEPVVTAAYTVPAQEETCGTVESVSNKRWPNL
jgi:hypothetical protein